MGEVLLKRYLEEEGLVVLQTIPIDVYQLLSVGFFKSVSQVEEFKRKLCNEIVESYYLYRKYFVCENKEQYSAIVFQQYSRNAFTIDAILDAAARITGTCVYLYSPPCRRYGFLETAASFQEPLYLASVDGITVSLVVKAQEAMEYEALLQTLGLKGAPTSNMDVSEEEDDDEDSAFQHVVIPNPTLEFLDPTQYIRNVCGGSARNTVTILLIVPGQSTCDTAKEFFETFSPKRMYVTMVQSSTVVKKFCNDCDLMGEYMIYMNKLPLPWTRENQNIAFWISKIFIPWLLLSATNFRWNGISITAICGNHPNNTIFKLLQRVWHHVQLEVQSDLISLLASPDSLICLDCSTDCDNHGKPWHFDLKSFHRLPERNDELSSIFARYNFLDNLETSENRVAARLTELRCSNADLRTVLDYVNLLASNSQDTIKYRSYLILILDGEDMESLSNASMEDLLTNDSVMKSVYAGCTLAGEISPSHFKGATSVGKILTSTSKVYLLRQVEFQDWVSALSDEAANIQILKSIWSKAKRAKQDPPYILLNVRSEKDILYSLTTEDQTDIIRFINSNQPIFRLNEDVADEDDSQVRFTGNYFPNTLVRMAAGPYRQRSFADVSDLYDELRRREHI